MSQCFNIVYLAGGFTLALNAVLHGAERERLGVPVFKLAKDHWYPAHRKLRQDFLGVGALCHLLPKDDQQLRLSCGVRFG
jgi:hypothetical protein